MTPPARPYRGFTIIELMITLSIAAILLAIGVPSFRSTIKNNRLVVATNETIGAFRFARTEAFRRGNRVHIASGDAGWVVFVDGDDDDEWDDGEEIRLWNAFPSGVSVTPNKNYIVFDASGIADDTDTITVCDDRSGERGSQISLLISGDVNKSKIDCS